MIKRLVFIVFLIFLWKATCKYFDVPAFLLPSPEKVFTSGLENISLLYLHTKAFLIELSISFILSILIGFSLAILSASSKSIDDTITPLIIFFQGVPKLALAPFVLIFFGFGLWPKVFIATMMGFLAVYLGTLKGLKNVNPDIIELATVCKASDREIMLKIRIPSAVPDFFSGLKISIPSILGGVIISEFMVGNLGLAYLVFSSAMSFDVSLSFAAVILLSLIGVSLFMSVCYIEKRVSWNS